ncbi:MAG: hypothetical protein EHM42_15075 [Planctomycetaceae bacterium]|nr:MAG: hypothetical protein EHM42_15075 [Planctomycetaceae bacterium]
MRVGRSASRADVPVSTPITLDQLLATVLHSLFDVSRLRLQPGIPREIALAIEQSEPIRELTG